MLKKQTVWLLTMLSLMIVLSVYYLLSDPNDDFAYIDDGKTDLEETIASDQSQQENNDSNSNLDDDQDLDQDETGVGDITNIGRDELFTTIRLELQNERSMMKSRYEDIVASSSATTEEKNEALNQINSLDQISTKESILQSTILSSSDKYEDVLVRHDEDIVFVHVRTDELSAQEANHIMQMVNDEFGQITVAVDYQSIR